MCSNLSRRNPEWSFRELVDGDVAEVGRLAEVLEGLLGEDGCEVAYLYVWSNIVPAARFWRRRGYHRAGAIGVEEGYVIVFEKAL